MNDYQITEAMIVYGGGFVHKLGWLFRAGDEINRRRLKKAFPAYWQQYAALAERDRQRAERAQAKAGEAQP